VTLELDRTRILAFLDAAERSLVGDWVLVGGALVAVWLAPRRVTEDIDLIGLSETGAERMALMELAEREGLPIESVNSAADFFLFRIAGWRDELAPLRTGGRARILRPSPLLFLLLKIGRLSEQDLSDCEAALDRVDVEGNDLDRPRVLRALADLAPTDDEALALRRERLRARLAAPRGP
jgi:hypothetical protein